MAKSFSILTKITKTAGRLIIYLLPSAFSYLFLPLIFFSESGRRHPLLIGKETGERHGVTVPHSLADLCH
jgi:hypothetical protein